MTPQVFRTIRGAYTLSELSQMIGVTTRTIRRYENGTLTIVKPIQILMGLVDEGVITLQHKAND